MYVTLLHHLFAQLASSAVMFQDFHIPLLYVYSYTDEFVNSQLNAEFAEIFGARSNSTDSYDADCQPTDVCTETGNLFVSKFHN